MTHVGGKPQVRHEPTVCGWKPKTQLERQHMDTLMKHGPMDVHNWTSPPRPRMLINQERLFTIP